MYSTYIMYMYLISIVCMYVPVLLFARSYLCTFYILQITPYFAQYFPVTFSAVQPYVCNIVCAYVHKY